jgi:hypothetical protein
MTRFHDRTLALLGNDAPRAGRPVEALIAWGKRNDIRLPAAFLEWAGMDDGSLLHKYSNDDWFGFDEPEIIVTPDGVRGLAFNSENQNNFDRIVTLDHGDDPPVLFAWIGRPPWVKNAERFSDAIYAQVFDWQYWLEFDADDPGYKEIGYTGNISLKEDCCLSLFRERYEETVSTRYVTDDNSYVDYRFVKSPALRLTVVVDANRATEIQITLAAARPT